MGLNAVDRIPNELLIYIARECAIEDKARLTRTSRRYHAIVGPLLYKSSICTDTTLPGCSPAVLWGARNGRLGTIKAAVAQGARVDTLWCLEPAIAAHRTGSDPPGWKHPQPVEGLMVYGPVQTATFMTALHAAARSGHDDVVAYLLDAGCALEAWGQDLCLCKPHSSRLHPRYIKCTPLHAALCASRISTVRLLLSRGAAVDAVCFCDGVRIPALHTAAARGLAPLIRHIIERGYDINSLDGAYAPNPAINYAVATVDNAAILELVKLGAVTEGRGTMSPLYDALIRRNHDAALRLLRAGVRADVEFFGKTPLHLISLHDRVPSFRDGSFEKWPELVSLLLEKGADINARIRPAVAPLRCETALFSRCQNPVANVDIIAHLLKAGADPNIPDANGNTPLHAALGALAVLSGRGATDEAGIKPLSLLLQHGASVGDNLEAIQHFFQAEVGRLGECRGRHSSLFLEAAKTLPSRSSQPWSLIDDALERLVCTDRVENCFCSSPHLVDSLMRLALRPPEQELINKSATRCFEMGLVASTQAWLRHGAKIWSSTRRLGEIETDFAMFLGPIQLELLRGTNPDFLELDSGTAMEILAGRRLRSLEFPDATVFVSRKPEENVCEGLLRDGFLPPM